MNSSIWHVRSMNLEGQSCLGLRLIAAVSPPTPPSPALPLHCHHQDSKQVVESYKSGFEPPGDVEFEDYGQAMKRTASDTSLTTVRETKEKPGKGKGKLWPFIKNKNKVTLLKSPSPADS